MLDNGIRRRTEPEKNNFSHFRHLRYMMYVFFCWVDYILTTSYQKNLIFKAFHEKKCYFLRKISFKTVFLMLRRNQRVLKIWPNILEKDIFRHVFMLLTLFWMCWYGTRIIQLEFEAPMAYRIIFMPTLDVAANSDIFPIFLTFQKVDKNSQRKSQKIIPKMVPSR